MKGQVLILMAIVSFLTGCSNDYYHDSKLANGKHDCSIWEYMQNDPDNWELVSVMIEKGGLKNIFDGSHPDYPQITFFGPTNYSVREFLLKHENDEGERIYHSLNDVPAEVCRQMVLSHIVPKRMMKDEFDYEIKGTETGGTIVKTLTGIDLRVYRIKTPYHDIPDLGPEYLAIHALEKGYKVDIASADIECTNGVVHSLSNTYEMAEL